MKKFRALKANEIEVRVAQAGSGWAQLLLYKNARVDMEMLDETVGPENWDREHYEMKGNLFCRVGINVNAGTDLEPRWVYKSDCGSESYTEKEKGESSDSFKRACFCWNIGRELYSSPAIFVNVETVPNKHGSGYSLADRKERFKVSKIAVDKEKNIILALELVNKAGKVVFQWYDNEKINSYKSRQVANTPAAVENTPAVAPKQDRSTPPVSTDTPAVQKAVKEAPAKQSEGSETVKAEFASILKNNGQTWKKRGV